MENKICQSCGMPLTTKEELGTNKDGITIIYRRQYKCGISKNKNV